MKTIVAFFGLLVVASAFPINDGHVELVEDTLGNYKLSYTTGTASRTEQRFEDGRVIGSYGYTDLEGVKHTVHYVAAADQGFGAEGDDIPQEVKETAVPVSELPELIKAREEHHEAFAKAQAEGGHEDAAVPAAHVLAQLGEVPEIAELPAGFVPAVDAQHLEARAMLLSAYSDVLARLAEEYRKL